MNKMKNIVKKVISSLLNIPVPYILTFSVISGLIILVIAQGNTELTGVIAIAIILSMFYLQIKLGSIVIKSIISGFVILYFISLYSYLTNELHGYIVQPFILTLAIITSFLAMTYISHNLSLRSRPIWSAMLAFIIVSFKSGVLIAGYSFTIAEILGLNIAIIYCVTWYFWANNSRKSKVVFPLVSREEIEDNFKYIFIKDRMNVKDKKWLNKEKKSDNAYPYIFTEIMKATEEKLTLVIVSELITDKTYDVGYVRHNSKEIPYLYIEAKTDVYVNDIINQFKQEILKI